MAADAANVQRLRMFVDLFGLTQADLCRATGYSRPFLSRVLAGNLKAGERFWTRLNASLLKMLDQTGVHCSVFRVGK